MLGAGASASFENNGIACPCVRDFFVCAAKLGLFERYTREDMMSGLWRFLRVEFGVRKKDLENIQINIEEVLTLLDQRIEEYEKSRQYRVHGYLQRGKVGFHLLATRFQLIAFISHVLLEITNNKLCPLHKRLADQLDSDDVVITFNYDLLMDEALLSTGNWIPDTGYGISFKSVIEKEKFVKPGTLTKAQTMYFKLHGSLNWLHGENPYNWMSIGVNLPLGQDIFLLRKIKHEVVGGPIDVIGKYEYEEKGIYYDLHSLLIAPRLHKPYGAFSKMFNTLWDKAQRAVEKATEMVVIGYSIPDSDVRCKELIAAAGKGGSKPAITIVDSSAREVEGRLKTILGYGASRVFSGMDEYIVSMR